ncbi:MAG: hypothetical protein LUE90_05405, partial [Clostridiales bacterium]|nr:hypothetical protein [Clostridiales bacterium]
MLNQFSRTELLLGKDGIERLSASCVAVFGIGGEQAILSQPETLISLIFSLDFWKTTASQVPLSPHIHSPHAVCTDLLDDDVADILKVSE